MTSIPATLDRVKRNKKEIAIIKNSNLNALTKSIGDWFSIPKGPSRSKPIGNHIAIKEEGFSMLFLKQFLFPLYRGLSEDQHLMIMCNLTLFNSNQ